ncbi:TBC1 domain family member 14 isoform X1 [Xenopus laevis]|uniref:TBC1 domain family member 14 isoform X1 n=1 Tax=Xenopus laevis TaxID=8355 RepID=A0A8J0TZS9_XENLA|nr:TBC1 domain family member 14 isoform X1 [Xenopus laevis]XP_018098523.1 TBC1 domain family member 14 isoform X1 [Xenopus laevis]XP_041435326.1 TBC1 domain family member 14 isoform X1 [Xenopus laevis]
MSQAQHAPQQNGGLHSPVTPWSNMNKDVSTNIKNLGFIEVQDINIESEIPALGKWNLKGAQSFGLPEYRPSRRFATRSGSLPVSSRDYGIPTLEIAPPEAVQTLRPNFSSSALAHERVFQNSKTISGSNGPPSLSSTEPDHVVWKSSTLPRSGYNTAKLYSPTSLNRSDDVSDCSISSLSTDFSTTLSVSNEDIVDFVVMSNSSAIVALENDDTHFSEVTLNSTKDGSADGIHESFAQEAEVDKKLKIFGSLSNLFNRNIFARKKSVSVEKPDDLGWKLFSRFPQQGSPRTVTKEYEERIGRASKSLSPKQNVRKSLIFEPLSTTALILEDRPANLPAKPAEEAQKHRLEYEEMVAQAKRREFKDAQRKKKQLEERCKLEESIGNAALTWNTEILPNWETTCCSRRVRDMWWQGIPPSVRGRVWSLAIGNEMNITHDLYDICLSRAKDRWKSLSMGTQEAENEDSGLSVADREASLESIKLDISRTFPNLCIFQKGGPYHDMLHSILGAYTCYRPDVGYVQGMSFIAAVLILNLDTADAFIAFSNLLNKPCQMAFFRVDHGLMLTYFAAFEVFFEENLPKLFIHFKKNNLTPDIYLIDWIFTLYSKSLPLDLACRVWDVFCRDGEEFLFRTALGILRLFEDILTRMDFIHIAQFLTKLPEDLNSEDLFASIAAIQMQSRNKKWSQVLSALQKDNRDMENRSPSLKR